MKLSTSPIVVAACLIATPAAIYAADPPREQAEAFRKLIDCRAIADQNARLACYDAQVSVLETATANNDVVVVDRSQIRKAKKTLFGLNLPSLSIFGGGGDAKAPAGDEVREIESTVKSASQTGLDKWIIILEDGARWVQTESKPLARHPEAGMPIRIRRAAMGSFMANIDGQTAIRVRREN